MIAHLSGTLLAKAPQSLIIENGGIGYEVTVPLSTFYALPDQNGRVSLYIYTHVREDALMLFGFYTPLEKEIFTMLLSVSGIGPKLATNILSGIGPEDLLEAMAGGDAARMQSIPGIGRKTAERIALELRERAMKLRGTIEPSVPQVIPSQDKGMMDDAASALVNLGYSAKSARDAVEKARSRLEIFNLQSLIKEALRVLA